MKQLLSINITGTTVFYFLLLLAVFFFSIILQQNYTMYKHHIRLKRLFFPIPQDHFYRFSEKRMQSAKKYNALLLVFQLILLITFLYVGFTTRFFRDPIGF